MLRLNRSSSVNHNEMSKDQTTTNVIHTTMTELVFQLLPCQVIGQLQHRFIIQHVAKNRMQMLKRST